MKKMEKIRLGSIIKTNQNNYSTKEKWSFVNYLDTGNIIKNKIDTIQYIDLKENKLPSRAKRKVSYNNIIYSTVRPNQLHYGIIKEQPKNFLVSTGFTVIEVDTKVAIPDYIYYVLSQYEITEQLQAIGEQGVSAYPSIKPSDIENLEILFPSIEIQEKIVSVLSSIDNKISINDKINNNLEQQVSSIYKSWFEDFDLSNGTCPSNWVKGTFSTIIDISSGKRPPIKNELYSKETPFPIIGASSIMGYTSNSNNQDKILVIGRVGTHGIVQKLNRPCWPSDNTLIIKSPYYEFVNQILRKIDYSSLNRGSTQPLITQSDIKKIEILIPDQETIFKFEKIATTLMNLFEENSKENEKLSLLKDEILPKLISGEIDISSIKI